MMRLPLSLVSPAGSRGRLSILIYHRVLAQADPLAPDVPDARAFEMQMRWVRAWFNVMPLRRAVDLLYAGRIPPRALAITFDDGYADNEEIAAPILRRLGMSATFFISTGYLDGGCMWNDRIIEAVRTCRRDSLDLGWIGLEGIELTSQVFRQRAVGTILERIKHLPPAERSAAVERIESLAGTRTRPVLMMATDQVRRLRSQGMEIGAHTVTHPILTRLDDRSARDEMLRGKQHLEDLLDEAVELFAYPNGAPGRDYAAAHVAIAAECGFRAAVSTAWGAASMRSDPFQLPRFTPWDSGRTRFGARLLANYRRAEQVVAS